jgi:hypothetical protein
MSQSSRRDDQPYLCIVIDVKIRKHLVVRRNSNAEELYRVVRLTNLAISWMLTTNPFPETPQW